MKLYSMAGTCSMASHIALREAGLDFDLVRVGRDKQTSDGQDYLTVNPYGYVPALRLDDGEVLLEGAAILQYIADLAPAAGLAPPAGTMARYRLQAALAFTSSEIHKTLSPLFKPDVGDDVREATIARLTSRLDLLNGQFSDREWFVGDRFTVADAYLFVVLGWLRKFRIDLGRWPALAAHQARVAARPAVQAALATENSQGGKNG